MLQILFVSESGREDSNLRPSAPKADALAGLRYAPKGIHTLNLQATTALSETSPRDEMDACLLRSTSDSVVKIIHHLLVDVKLNMKNSCVFFTNYAILLT